MIIKGGFTDGMKGEAMSHDVTPIIMTGLSVGFAFKTGLFTMELQDSLQQGVFAAVYVGIKWTFLPASIHWLVALLAAKTGRSSGGKHSAI